MRRLGTLPTDWREFSRSLVPLALLGLAAAVGPLRVPVLIALIAGVAIVAVLYMLNNAAVQYVLPASQIAVTPRPSS